MNPICYTALIRTYNSARTLPKTLATLRAQTMPALAHVIVDSGSTDNTLSCVPDDAVVHRYVGAAFNYSEALNQGLDHVTTEYVLIISSHTSLNHVGAIEFALNILAGNERLGGAYFCDENPAALEHKVIDASNFTGFNGLWNTCSVIKTALLKKRRFRPEVFAAEDQEWSRWLFHCEGKAVARISGAGLENNNPRKFALKKLLNEHAAIALFTNRRLLGWRHLAYLAYVVMKPTPPLALRQRYIHLALLIRLLTCHFTKPGFRSERS